MKYIDYLNKTAGSPVAGLIQKAEEAANTSRGAKDVLRLLKRKATDVDMSSWLRHVPKPTGSSRIPLSATSTAGLTDLIHDGVLSNRFARINVLSNYYANQPAVGSYRTALKQRRLLDSLMKTVNRQYDYIPSLRRWGAVKIDPARAAKQHGFLEWLAKLRFNIGV